MHVKLVKKVFKCKNHLREHNRTVHDGKKKMSKKEYKCLMRHIEGVHRKGGSEKNVSM